MKTAHLGRILSILKAARQKGQARFRCLQKINSVFSQDTDIGMDTLTDCEVSVNRRLKMPICSWKFSSSQKPLISDFFYRGVH